ncbi:MAG: hypothetical protein E7338_04335 [Clostridiales bacterium]|nr:hypothetical protein [Clostridiales bacterium]
MARKTSIVVVLLIAILAVFSTAYCFADHTLSLVQIDDISKIDVENILSAFSDDYLSLHEDDEVVVIATYSDDASHDIAIDLSLLGIEAKDRYSYSNIFNGQSFSIKIKDISSLTSLSYIKSVELANKYYELSVDTQSYSTLSGTNEGVIDNTTSYKGEGVVVAVVDAGFDTSHVAFSNITSSTLALNASDIKDVLYDLNAYEISGVSYQSLYISDKIAYAYDYAEGDTDLYFSSESHGTHVAGIVAGNSSTLQGVVPNAQLALMKVADEEGAMYNDTIAAALEDCLKLDVDVVNMSLGTNSGFEIEEDSAIYKAITKLKQQGVTVVCAAGNSYTSAYGGDNGTNLATSEYVDNAAIGSPASYEETIAVGNVAEKRWIEVDGEKITYNNALNTAETKYGEFAQDILGSSSSKDVEYVILMDGDDIALGKVADYEGVDVTGKIVVVKRGEITFEEKVQNAKTAGAEGIIIVNSESTTITAGITTVFPTCVVTKETGELLKEKATSNVGTLSFKETYIKKLLHASSSSGVTDNLNLGVDVVTFGTSVYSSGNDQTYVQMTGTSMASPNMAGIYAAVIGYVKDASGLNISNKVEASETATKLIMSTADLLTDFDGILLSPRSQGAGFASIEDAISTKAYISSEGTYKSKIELGENVTKDITLSFEIENLNTFDATFDLSIDVLTELLKDGNMSGYEKALTFTINSVTNSEKVGDVYEISVESGAKKAVEVTITLSNEALDYLSQFENGIYIEGYVKLNDGIHSIDISCPFVGFYGDWDSQDILDITAYEDDDDTDAYMRASTAYGLYADSYYMPLGQFAFKLEEDQKAPQANEEFAALSIFSQSMYSLGYIQLGLLRNAEYIEVEVHDMVTGKIVYTTDSSYVPKTTYYPSYGVLLGGDFSVSVSPYALDLYNNEQYEVVVKVYRKYDKDGENEVSGTFSQKFYVDEETPTIDDVTASKEGNKYLAKFKLSDNHYIQALAICTGTGSTLTGVTLNVEDIYPIATTATGVGQSVEVTYDVTEAIKNATNGYLYFYVVDYAFNENVYYYSVKNWTGTESNIISKGSNNTTTDSSTPSTDTSTIDTSTIQFTQTEIEVSVNKEVDLATNTYLSNYDVNKKYTWASSDTETLAVSSGKITGLQEGTAIVYIQDENGNEASMTVRVQASTYPSAEYQSTKISSYEMVDSITNNGSPFFGINLAKSKIELAPGESFTLEYSYSPYNYNYIQNPITITVESSDDTVVKVTNGVIAAQGAGEATLTIRANGTLVNTYTIKVADSVYVNDDGILLACFDSATNIDLSSRTEIVAIGANAFSYAKNVETLTLPTSCKVICDKAFYGNTSIEAINGISSITSIGDYAFYGCSRLETIDLQNVSRVGIKAFNGCVNLTTVLLDETNLQTMYISTDAFLNCPKLTSFKVGSNDVSNIVINGELKLVLSVSDMLSDSSITSIGEGALTNVTSTTLDLSSMNLTRIEVNAFKGNKTIRRITLPSTIEYIGQSAFEGCTALQVVNIQKTTDQELEIASRAFYNTAIATIDLTGIKTTFGDYVFAKDSRLSSINLGIVQKMGKYTFAASSNLTRAIYENGSIDLGDYTFAPITMDSKTYYHQALRQVVVPSSITKINGYVFAYCDKLSNESMDLANVEEVGEYAFVNCLRMNYVQLPKVTKLGYAAFAQSGVVEVYLNNAMQTGTLEIGELAFYKCGTLESVYIPSGANVEVTLFRGAFYNCKNLTEINFNNVVSIGDYAFTDDEKLEQAIMPICKSIGYAAFADCESLATVQFNSIEEIGSLSFYNTKVSDLTIPNTIKTIDEAAFTDTEINILINSDQDYSQAKIKLDTKDGKNVLYRVLDDGTYMLIYYPQTINSVSYTVIDNTSAIGEYAFEGNESLVRVVLPQTITRIGNGAFYGCENLGFVQYKGENIPKLLGAYNTVYGTSQYNFVTYKDTVDVIVILNNEEIVEKFEGSTSWQKQIENFVSYDTSIDNMISFVEKAMALKGQSITDENTAQFLELKAAYDALNSDEKSTLSSLSFGKTALNSYNEQLKEYKAANSIIDDISNKTGLSTIIVVLLIIAGAGVLIAGAVGITFIITRRRMEVEQIRQSNEEAKDLEDIFGKKENKDEKIDLDSVFEVTKVEENEDGEQDSSNKEE